MSDRELLELAAKAAGYEKDWQWNSHFIMSAGGSVKEGNSWITWNPLTDDGDALRLAVKLGMLIDTKDEGSSSVSVNVQVAGHYIHEEYAGLDPYAATRRAIVRAAAEIGKSMEDQ